MGHSPRPPCRPTHISPYADACLHALARRGLGHKLSIGGGLGLLHYLDYRPTHDVDAWWARDTTSQERQAVIQVIKDSLDRWGEVTVRSWGEVISIELSRRGETTFSFQIAHPGAVGTIANCRLGRCEARSPARLGRKQDGGTS